MFEWTFIFVSDREEIDDQFDSLFDCFVEGEEYEYDHDAGCYCWYDEEYDAWYWLDEDTCEWLLVEDDEADWEDDEEFDEDEVFDEEEETA